MFSKLFIATLALASVAFTAPTGETGPSAGTPQCCQNVMNAGEVDATTVGLVKTLIGLDISVLNVPIGTGCTPLSLLGGVSCNQNVVTCGRVISNALIAIDCVPVIINV